MGVAYMSQSFVQLAVCRPVQGCTYEQFDSHAMHVQSMRLTHGKEE